ncbi:MAG TPA: CNP1-like family protein [Burkholderiales bacterium]|nr:CNP1-like family protein [Burkholderiales bacterium]
MRSLAFLGVLVAGTAFAQQYQKSDWETQYEERLREQRLQEEGLKMLPAFPKNENLIEFEVSGSTSFRFFVDAASLSVEDNVVRYTIVARSSSGTDNVAYEALRCDTRQYRMYATGRPDGTWSARLTPWRDYPRITATGWHHVLSRQYFCPSNRESVQSVREAVDALRAGGHPVIKGR